MCFIFDKLYCYKYDGLIEGQNKMWDTTKIVFCSLLLPPYTYILQHFVREHGGLVVDHQPQNREVSGSIPTWGTVSLSKAH